MHKYRKVMVVAIYSLVFTVSQRLHLASDMSILGHIVLHLLTVVCL